MNEKSKKALDLLEHIRKATLETDIDEMGGLALTDESCFENEINELKDIVNDFDRYYESQQDLIKGKDEYIAKLCNDRAELKAHEEELNELREFAKVVSEKSVDMLILRQANKNTDYEASVFMPYTLNRQLTQVEFDLVKKVVEKYGQEEKTRVEK